MDKKIIIVIVVVIALFFYISNGGEKEFKKEGTMDTIWYVEYGLNAKIHQLNPSDGTILKSFGVPTPTPTGLAWDGSYLWLGGGDTIYKLDQGDGSVVSSIASPGGDASGLTYDGNYLWNADMTTNKIYKINPADGSTINQFDAPTDGDYPLGLAWDGSGVYISMYHGDKIYKLDPSTGNMDDPLVASDSQTRGLTWDGGFLWMSRDTEDVLYKLDPMNPHEISLEGQNLHGITWQSNACTPDNTCSSLGYECGSFTDSCGDVKQCGSCGTGETCDNHQCVQEPTTCPTTVCDDGTVTYQEFIDISNAWVSG